MKKQTHFKYYVTQHGRDNNVIVIAGFLILDDAEQFVKIVSCHDDVTSFAIVYTGD